MDRAEIRKQVNELWKQAVDQFEEVKEVLTGRLEVDLVRLRGERDRLLKTLGEQTYKLANQGKLPVPAIVKKTVDRLNEVINGLVNAQKGGAAKKSGGGGAKKAAKKTGTRKKKTRAATT
jgi:hypothetical protein